MPNIFSQAPAFHRPQVKPKQWGPVNVVKNAVRHYYENTLGVAAPVLYMPFWERSGNKAATYGSMQYASAFSATPPVFTPVGLSTGPVVRTINLGSPVIKDNFTAVAGINMSAVTSGYNAVFGQWASGATGRLLCYLDTNRILTIGFSGTAFYSADTVITLKQNEHIAYTKTGTAVNFYRSGIKGSTTGNTGTTSVYSGVNTLIGGQEGTAWGFDGVILYAGMFDFKLPDDKLGILGTNPYAAIQPLSIPVYFLPASGGGGTTETIETTSAAIALTGQTLGISATEYISTDTCAVALTGQAITFSSAQTVYPDTASIALAGQTTAIQETVVMGAGACVLTGQDMVVSTRETLFLDTAGIAVTCQDLTVTANTLIATETALIRYIGQNLVWEGSTDTAPGKIRCGLGLRLR